MINSTWQKMWSQFVKQHICIFATYHEFVNIWLMRLHLLLCILLSLPSWITWMHCCIVSQTSELIHFNKFKTMQQSWLFGKRSTIMWHPFWSVFTGFLYNSGSDNVFIERPRRRLSSLLQEYTQSRILRSSKQLLLREKKACLKSYGDRAFSVAAPSLWNSLPIAIRNCDTVHAQKAFLFEQVYNVQYISFVDCNSYVPLSL